jgi:hypothetical protein
VPDVLLVHFAATVFMTGLIWFVQVVHYPLFARVPAEGFVPYERAHVQRTGWVVGPPMLIEVGTAAWIILRVPATAANPWFLAAFLLLLVIWIATAAFSVPAHGVLSERPDAAVIRRLVATNWIRTAGWTARSLLLLPLVGPTA